mmetsp:Transcript_14207/g.30408  ORF Transcript_14207/g.30408 Transcript_14207/m.30408 type:complete len:253 (+) Transcript_14207:156-914(+)|eukprot:CAMPEP_0118927186 /NCGR_PEP_ID=MMETSP1169-20130426/4707_1 /TAXON_ID=36882 /ORGANISM="Pyramimonas obovata, Strain CCMP722" /LENGTH=252 /DNA_ID=CAMNT_0006868893 /DNA_START=109 /DNA_END=870 /DNA_ORIENTATION=+
MAAAETYSPFAPVTSNAPLIQKGKRQDGRYPEECRPLFLKLEPVLSATGSAYLEFKDTKIMCSVFGPRQNTKGGAAFTSDGQLRCDVKFATFATRTRRKYGQDPEAKDITTAVHGALQGAVLLDAFPKAIVDVQIMIIESQGGEVSAAITCASAALAHAGIPMRDLVLGASVAQVEGELVLDPSSSEEQRADGIMTMGMMPSANEVTQLLSKGAWAVATTTEAMELCMDGCSQLDEIVREVMRTHLAAGGSR